MGLCVGMYFVYIRPTVVEIGTKRDKLTEYNGVIETTKELKDLRDSLSTKYNDIPADKLLMLSKIIPGKFDSVHFTNDLSAMATKYGMAIKTIRVSNPVSQQNQNDVQVGENTYKTVNASFTVSGRYDQFSLFLKDLEASLRLIDVVGLSVKSGSAPKKGEEVIMDFAFDIQTYSLQ